MSFPRGRKQSVSFALTPSARLPYIRKRPRREAVAHACALRSVRAMLELRVIEESSARRLVSASHKRNNALDALLANATGNSASRPPQLPSAAKNPRYRSDICGGHGIPCAFVRGRLPAPGQRLSRRPAWESEREQWRTRAYLERSRAELQGPGSHVRSSRQRRLLPQFTRSRRHLLSQLRWH
jgi:hypothetical protein